MYLIFLKYLFSYFIHQFGPSFFSSMENVAADVLMLMPLTVRVQTGAHKKGHGQVRRERIGV